MNLLCPSCQKMLQVPDQFAGQQMRCPLCNSIFTVPGLPDAPPPAHAPAPPPPLPVSAPPPPVEAFKFADSSAPSPPILPPVPDPTKSKPAAPPPAPIKERDFISLKSYFISKRVVPWIAPIALSILFLLSFFPWLSGGKGGSGLNPWSLAFGEFASKLPMGGATMILYVLLMLFAFLTAVGSFLIHLRVLPQVPALEKIRTLIVAGLTWSAFLFLTINLLISLFDIGAIWLNFFGWLAWKAHFVATIALVLETWLQIRGPEAPSPRIDIHL